MDFLVRAGGWYDTDKASRESGLECRDKSRTIQSQSEDADINVIVKRFGITGQLPQNIRVPLQEDFLEAMTFHEAQAAVRAAEESFAQLPAQVRARFQNEPSEAFLDWCADPENLAEMRNLGMAVKRDAEEGTGPLEKPKVP